MCMPSVNAIVELYRVAGDENSPYQFFDTFVISKTQKALYDFNMVVTINLMGTNNESKEAENIVNRNGIQYFLIRVVRYSETNEEVAYMDIDRFSVDTSASDVRRYYAVVPYVNYKRTIHIDEMMLQDDPCGYYVIKVLTKADQDEQWNTQSMSPFYIELEK